jgi:nitronate monooxygenase
MAPMFLVSNVAMVLESIKAGITGVIPALNFRTNLEFRDALYSLSSVKKVYGINLIVNRSNYKLKEQLQACLEFEVPFIITSLGDPKEVIESCHQKNIKVFCDVSTMEYARKAMRYYPDALIAVTNLAGGHLGPLSPEEFIPKLKAEFPDTLIISAGGVGTFRDIQHMISLGADGVSVGSIFIASTESPVSEDYKQACVDYTDRDIVTTTKLSGVPCTVINTPFLQEMGTQQNWLEKVLSKNKSIKKWIKMFVYKKGMKRLAKSAFSVGYHNIWCAGKSIKYVRSIRPVSEIVKDLVTEY